MIVVKVGGAEGINVENTVKDLASYEKFVLVHGGSGEVNRLQTKLGVPPRMVTSVSGYTSRFTDKRKMVCGGKINKEIVQMFQQLGVNAIGLSGVDGRLLEARRKDAIKIVENGKKKVLRGDFTGKVESVNVRLLDSLLENGYVPVIAPIAITQENVAVNVDGDRAAAAIAGALNAESLIILSNVPGLMNLRTNEVIAKISVGDCMEYAEGRMRKKILGAKEALEAGIDRVILGDANVENPVTGAIQGAGTVIV
ncbi:MAG: [LysW]-aminoadipate kinase [Thermoplasmata archaeon]